MKPDLPMKRTIFLLASTGMIGAFVPASGQSLADVLSSLQERKQAVEQSRQVAEYLPTVDGQSPSVTAQELIDWAGLGEVYPTDGQLDGLGLDSKIELLNQAVSEFRDLQRSFVNIRDEDLAVDVEIGAIRPFMPEDFPDLGRAGPANYHAVLVVLARDVRRLKVLPWPLGGKQQTKRYWIDKYEVPVPDSSGGFVMEPRYAEGSTEIEGWRPEAIGPGEIDGDAETWKFTEPGARGLWGSWLEESSFFYALSDTDRFDDGEGGYYDRRRLNVEKIDLFHSDLALYASVPGRSDQLGGKIAVVLRNEWSPVDMGTVTVTAPNSWDPGEADYEGLLAEEDPGSVMSSGGEPSITLQLDWVALGSSAEPAGSDWNDGVPFGYSATKAWLEGPADPADADWLASWEYQQKMGPQHIANYDGITYITLFRRQLHGLCAPTFGKGLDAAGVADRLDDAEKFAMPPAGDGQPLPHPVPGILIGIPMGVGLDGATSGWVGVSPCEKEYLEDWGVTYPASSTERLVTRFDFAANLRFIGPAQDFHVVYATGRDAGDRGAELPAEGPTAAEIESMGNVSFFDAWDAPRLRQVVSRDLLIDVETLGHYKTQVKVYRRAAGAGTVDRTPGELATPSGALIRTVVFEHPNATGSYLSTPEKVHATDGGATHKAWRDGYPVEGAGPDPAIRFKMVGAGGEPYSEEITFPSAGQASILVKIDGLELFTDLIGVGGSKWQWWDHAPPSTIGRSAAGETTSITNAFEEGPGTQEGRHPRTTTITGPVEPEVSLTWSAKGLPTAASKGNWSLAGSMDGTAYKAEWMYDDALLGTIWTDWSDGDRTLTTHSAPDGGISSKGSAAVARSVLEFGDLGGTGLPGLPHRLVHIDGGEEGSDIGAVWQWSLVGNGSTKMTLQEGELSGTSATNGSKLEVTLNANGYLTATKSFRLQGGAGLQLAGSTATAFTAWGAPTAIKDYTTGLTTSVTYDGSRERITQHMDGLGVASTFGTFDSINRPTSVGWNGAAGSATYNSGGFGVSMEVGTLTHAFTMDAMGRPKTGVASAGDIGTSWQTTHAAAGRTTVLTDLASAGQTTLKSSIDAGALTEASGDFHAFGGRDCLAPEVDAGLFKTRSRLADQTACFRTTWTDAWGRMRKSAGPDADGAGDAETLFLYSTPASTVRRVEIREPSGRRAIRETEPWSGDGFVTRSGIDMNSNGVLDGNDRVITSTTAVVGGLLRTTLSQAGNATLLMVRDHDPSSGITTTTINGGEEVITESPDFTAKTMDCIRKRGLLTVETRTVAFNNLGQADHVEISGAGLAAVTIDPTFRADGTLSGLDLTVGGDTTSLDFATNGTLSGFTHPTLGVLAVSHGFATGGETLTIDGTTIERSLDGTANALTGDGVMDRERSTAASAGGFAETIDPAVGSSTVLSRNAAGAKTLHNYAAGADTQTAWLAGGLLESVSLGRGGSTFFSYSADGARELASIAWPAASSTGFPGDSFYAGAITLGRDAAGKVDSITDPSGERALDHEKNRLTSTDWLGGELNPYKVVRDYDASGRLDGVTVYRNGAAIHGVDFGYTGASDELAGVASGGFAANYTRNAGRYLTGVTRGPVTQIWGRGTAGRITSAGSNVAGGPSFTYNGFDAKGRRTGVATNRGAWTYTYRGGENGDGQLASASNAQLGTFAYNFDGIGRRTDFAGNGGDALNRFVAMTHPQVAKTLYVTADPAARVWFNGVELNPAPEDFQGLAAVPLPHPGASGGWVPWEVRGVLEGAGDAGAFPDAVSELAGQVWFPPTSESFTYDADGNRESSALWDYGWDGRNRLVRAATRDRLSAPEGRDLGFDYDAEGRRFKKVVTRYEDGAPVERKTVWFVWDGWDLLYERHEDAFGNLLFDRKYVWGADIAGGAGGLLLMREKRGQTTRDYYPLYDGSGHVIGLGDDAGNRVAEYWHGPFGELIEASGEMADANPWRYATKYYDKETGLYYFGHRYHDPATGQWLNREPLGESESLNLYAYCQNDPVNKVDVRGLAKVATDGRGNLNAFGIALAALAKQDLQAARSMLLAAQVQAETQGAGIEGLVGDGGGSAISNVLHAIRTASGNARSDGRNEWKHVALEARLGGGAAFDFDAHVPTTDALVSDLFASYSPLITASADATARHDAYRSAESARITALQSSPGYKLKELALGTADLPMHAAAALYTGFTMADITTGQAITWDGWGNAGFGLEEVSPGERAFAAGLAFIPVGRGAGFVDDFARGGIRNGTRTRFASFGGSGFSLTEAPGAIGTRISRRLTPDEMIGLSRAHGDIEFALVYRTGAGKHGRGGSYWLYSGEPGRVAVPYGSEFRYISHTHPNGSPVPSGDDIDFMLGLPQIGNPQRQSQLLPYNWPPVPFNAYGALD